MENNIIEDRPFACNLCDMRFKRRQYLERHHTVHSSEKIFSCFKCGSSYKYKKGLNRHLSRRHEKEFDEYKNLFQKKKPNHSGVWYPPICMYQIPPLCMDTDYYNNRIALFGAWTFYQFYLFFMGQVRFNL